MCLLSYMNYALCYEEVPQKKKFRLLCFKFAKLFGEFSVRGELGNSSVVGTSSSSPRM